MKKFFTFLIFGFITSIANAEVIALTCTYTDKKSGKIEKMDFSFSPDRGWVDRVFRFNNAVTPTQINTGLFTVDRETGAYFERGSGSSGTCKKQETKF